LQQTLGSHCVEGWYTGNVDHNLSDTTITDDGQQSFQQRISTLLIELTNNRRQ